MTDRDMKYATLRIYGHDLDPAKVTDALGVEPTSSQKRGDKVGPEHRKRELPVGGWFLTSKGYVESDDIADHILWLLEHVSSTLPSVRIIDEVTLVNIFCCWHLSGWNEGCRIDSSLLLELGRLGVSLDFDVYNWPTEN